MGRNATISICNETGYELNLDSYYLEHGKFNENPEKVIKKGATITFKVANNSGALIGPKGSVTYILCLTSLISVKLTFYWDHPFGSSSSSYEMGSDPDWFSSYYLDPSYPTGHDQTVTFVARLNDYGFDQSSWMSNLKPDKNIREVLLPGSHDSATYDINYLSKVCLDMENGWLVLVDDLGMVHPWSKAQSNSILDQLKQGIRYFDFRISNEYYDFFIPKISPLNHLKIKPLMCHSVGATSPETVFDDIETFLKTYKKEILILNFQHFYHNVDDATTFYQDIINQLKEKFGAKMVVRSSIESLTLQNLWDNNKQIIVFFDKDHKVSEAYSPGGGEDFSDAYDSLFKNNDFIWSSSSFLSNKWTNSANISDLKKELQKVIDDESENKEKLFVLQGVVTPDIKTYANAFTGGLPKSLEELGNEVTPNVESWVVNDWVDKNLNVIMCDFVSNSILPQLCYMINKKKNNI